MTTTEQHPATQLGSGQRLQFEKFLAEQSDDVRISGSFHPIDEQQALVARRVAPLSIAALAGVMPGDLLVDVSGRPAADVAYPEMIEFGKGYEYRFLQKERGQQLTFFATGVLLGVELEGSIASILHDVEQGGNDPDELIPLWELGYWNELKRAARRCA